MKSASFQYQLETLYRWKTPFLGLLTHWTVDSSNDSANAVATQEKEIVKYMLIIRT